MQRPLVGLTRRNLLRELLAGVTLLAIAMPLNIGYAQIAGLPPTAGLYALVVPTIVYVLVVSSRQVVASPDAAAAALVASSIGGLAAAGSEDYATMALAQAILCGVMFILLSVFKLGLLANFLSKPILVGFVGGLALDILVSQVAKMLGVKIDSGGEFLEKLGDLLGGLGTANVWAVVISVASVAVLLLGKKFLGMVPWALVVMVAATLLVVSAGLDAKGVAVLGEVPAGAPTLTWPMLDWQTWLLLVPSAMALTLVTTAEGLLVSRSYGEKRHYRTEPNRDLLAFGVANIAAGAQGSFAVGSSTSRTAAMDQSGSRTQLPSLVLAVGTLLLLLFGTGLLDSIPSPAIGAIVGVAILPLLGFREFAALWRIDRFEFLIGAVCFLVTLFIGSIPGILVAFVLALINIAKRAATPAIDVLADNDNPRESLLQEAPQGSTTAPGLVVVRMAAPLFFANGDTFTQAVRHAVTFPGPGAVRHVVIDMEAVTDADVTAAESFDGLVSWLDDQGVTLSFSRLRASARTRLERLGILGGQRIFDTNRAAVAELAAPRSQTSGPASHPEKGKLHE
ncbi:MULTISPECIES: SulP family inorganic anion transporter [unclassified Microbacterium]|uniref:SulP family inorganic anion transporter n=1 Tax=unclassified Microbacterium TaxID=2609290 RepID=UPI000EA865B1|nr:MULTISPECIES: SulP family inorganic anion transporter [unclassified Microbacterium]MBT2485496.1 SulP family inorganic anion transporter [Microbacterium sp. ISL-108]RKN68288.1 SulP family inorganic anion transporter [Microbacterium sp. CGR2]